MYLSGQIVLNCKWSFVSWNTKFLNFYLKKISPFVVKIILVFGGDLKCRSEQRYDLKYCEASQ